MKPNYRKENRPDYIIVDDFEKYYSITEVCPHKIIYLKVIESIVNCETTVEVCEDCGKIVTEPKTDCR